MVTAIGDNKLNNYEGMFLVDNAIATNEWDELINHIQDILTKHGSEIIDTQKWGEMKLAYNIGSHSRGTYIVILFKAPNLSIVKIRRDCELSDKIVRSLIVRNDESKKVIKKSDSIENDTVSEQPSDSNESVEAKPEPVEA